MWGTIWRFFATRAATGWALAAGLALAGAMWAAYDHRGDKIAELEHALSVCQGSSEQDRIIGELRDAIDQNAQNEAQRRAEDIEALPDECYYLDGPSPLGRLYRGDGEG